MHRCDYTRPGVEPWWATTNDHALTTAHNA